MSPIISAALHGRPAVIFDWHGTLADTHERSYRLLCDALNPHSVTVDAEDCLAVEDAPDGVTAARRAGMRVLIRDR
jgi:beta-phosphoglucomutase-like phosphatase (HAD superfamily)